MLTLEALVELLEATFEDNSIAMFLIEDAVSTYDTVEDFKTYIEDLATYGCESGLLGALIYHKHVFSFFNEHYEAIADEIGQYEEEVGFIGLGYDAVTTLTYLAVDITANKVLWEMDSYLN